MNSRPGGHEGRKELEVVDFEIVRYKCQFKDANNGWVTVNEYDQEEDAEKWLRVALKYNGGEHRVIREEVMRLFE